MGLKKLLGLSTRHEGQHRPGKHTAAAQATPKPPKKKAAKPTL